MGKSSYNESGNFEFKFDFQLIRLSAENILRLSTAREVLLSPAALAINQLI